MNRMSFFVSIFWGVSASLLIANAFSNYRESAAVLIIETLISAGASIYLSLFKLNIFTNYMISLLIFFCFLLLLGFFSSFYSLNPQVFTNALSSLPAHYAKNWQPVSMEFLPVAMFLQWVYVYLLESVFTLKNSPAFGAPFTAIVLVILYALYLKNHATVYEYLLVSTSLVLIIVFAGHFIETPKPDSMSLTPTSSGFNNQILRQFLIAVLLSVLVAAPLIGLSPLINKFKFSFGIFSSNSPQGNQVSYSVSMGSLYNLDSGPPVEMFSVSTLNPSYYLLDTLDYFNGVSWSTANTPDLSFNESGHLYKATFTIQNYQGDQLPDSPDTVRVYPSNLKLSHGIIEATAVNQMKYVAYGILNPLPASGQFKGYSGISNKLLAPYLQLPKLPSRIYEIAHSIVNNAPDPATKAQLLLNYFLSGSFSYSLNPKLTNSPAALEKFLTVTKSGFCQQFATAFAVLARISGLPTRIAVGFDAGTQLAGNTYQLYSTDAHAWVQIYMGPQFGWVSYDPTPPQGAITQPQQIPGLINSTSTTSTTSVTSTSVATTPSIESSTSVQVSTTEAISKNRHVKSALTTSGGLGLYIYIVIFLFLAAFLLAFLSLKKIRKNKMELNFSRRNTKSTEVIYDSFKEITEAFGKFGVRYEPQETVSEYFKKMKTFENLAPISINDLNKLAQLLDKALYSQSGLNPDEKFDLTALFQSVVNQATLIQSNTTTPEKS
jgi:transglutaminase-like putative cysteine protease